MPDLAAQGIIAAPVLPMLPDQSIDWKSLRPYIASVAAEAPTAIAMNMDASEGHALSREEQVEVIRACRDAVAGACPVLSGLAAGSTQEAVETARRLRDAGADGFAVFPVFPLFVGDPLAPDVITNYYAAIAEAAEAPVLAFRMRVMAHFSREVLEALASLPRFIGFKDSTEGLPQMVDTLEILRSLPRKIGILTGNDPIILEAMAMGCDGAFIGFAATATGRLVRMHQALIEGRIGEAREIWRLLGPLARFCWRTPLRDYRQRMKEVLVMEGRIAHATVRLPQRQISAEERAQLRVLASAAGLIRSS